MYHYDFHSRSIKMVFIDNISYYGFPLVDFKKATWLIICLSIPAESKRVEKMLEPADEGS